MSGLVEHTTIAADAVIAVIARLVTPQSEDAVAGWNASRRGAAPLTCASGFCMN